MQDLGHSCDGDAADHVGLAAAYRDAASTWGAVLVRSDKPRRPLVAATKPTAAASSVASTIRATTALSGRGCRRLDSTVMGHLRLELLTRGGWRPLDVRQQQVQAFAGAVGVPHDRTHGT